eukprot:m51a1_g5100 putative thioredoxin 1 (110) ;mRNA; f:296824-297409
MSHGNVVIVKSLAEFNAQLEQAGSRLVVIDFFAQWCGPCKMIGPKFVDMSTSITDAVFLKADVDEAEDLAQFAGISAMPTFQFYKNKAKIDELVGASEPKLRQLIEKLK